MKQDLPVYFPDCQVFICDFHRLQAWERWFNKKDNGCSERKGDIIPKLRQIARSRTEADMNKAVEDFEFSKFWNQKSYPRLMSYLSNYWFNIKKVSTIILICRSF